MLACCASIIPEQGTGREPIVSLRGASAMRIGTSKDRQDEHLKNSPNCVILGSVQVGGVNSGSQWRVK
jgi:hypothetical protein